MRRLRCAIFGCGFWSRFQAAAWQELDGVEIAALYNRTRAKAEALADRIGLDRRHVYDDPEELLRKETLDFADVITDVDTHPRFVALCARAGLPVICQKPLGPSLEAAEGMAETCRRAGVPLFVHENWRWQSPIREFKKALDSAPVGRPFRARITYANSFPVFDNQPFLRDLDRFILTDIGTHILDTARFLFGDATDLTCRIRRVNPGIRGEDVATVMMTMGRDVTVVCEMSYASLVEQDRFPETYLQAECERGAVSLGPDFRLAVRTGEGTLVRRVPPRHYAWADPAYDVVHASIVPCNADLLRALRTGEAPETTAEDNLKTLRLVYGAYESHRRKQSIDPID